MIPEDLTVVNTQYLKTLNVNKMQKSTKTCRKVNKATSTRLHHTSHIYHIKWEHKTGTQLSEQG